MAWARIRALHCAKGQQDRSADEQVRGRTVPADCQNEQRASCSHTTPGHPGRRSKKATAVRENMKRLRELRLAKEVQEGRTEISTRNRPAKAKPKKRSRWGASVGGLSSGRERSR